jgi:hypothetical protein
MYYAWSKAYLIKPKDNIVIQHRTKCEKPVKKSPNFIERNKEAIANYRQEFLKRVKREEHKMGDGLKLRANVKACKTDVVVVKCISGSQ